MPVTPDSKYALQDLHVAIDLFDRKIAYCEGNEKFDSEQARALSLQSLVTKREALVKAALAMTGRGVKCNPKYMPRSFKQERLKESDDVDAGNTPEVTIVTTDVKNSGPLSAGCNEHLESGPTSQLWNRNRPIRTKEP